MKVMWMNTTNGGHVVKTHDYSSDSHVKLILFISL